MKITHYISDQHGMYCRRSNSTIKHLTMYCFADWSMFLIISIRYLTEMNDNGHIIGPKHAHVQIFLKIA